MRHFKGFRRTFTIEGNEADAYFSRLPEHDLGVLSNYFARVAKARPINVCIDGGANIGLAALLMHDIAPQAVIYSFEPSQKTARYARTNIDRNEAGAEIVLINAALGESEGTARFFDDEAGSSANHIVTEGAGHEVAVETIDGLVAARGITGVDFIKLDVEGFEDFALHGGVETLRRFRPVIQFEFNPYAILQNSKREPLDVLQRIMNVVGALVIADPLTGATTPLPADPHRALSIMNDRSAVNEYLFDLVNQTF